MHLSPSVKFKSVILGIFALVMTGCGSVSKVSELSAEINPSVKVNATKMIHDAVVSIRFPMLASENAKQQLVSDYVGKLGNVYGGDSSDASGHEEFTANFAPMLFEQSTYYAAELKKQLGNYLDEKNIYLEPIYVDYKYGQFALMQAIYINTPANLVIDLYDFPATYKGNIGYGSTLTASIRSAGGTSPATCGNLFVTGKHFQFYGNKTKCVGQDAREVPHISPLQYFSEEEIPSMQFPMHEGKPIATGTILVTGSLAEDKNDDYLKKAAEPTFKVTTDNIHNPAVDWLARASVNALLKIDTQAAFDAGFAVYLHDFDAALAQRLRSHSLAHGDERKLAVARKLLEAESDWLASQNAAITEGILNGNYGKSFRQTRWVLAQAYNKSQALQWLQVGAMLIGGFSSGLFGGAGAYNPSMLMASTLQTEQQFSAMQNQIEQALLDNLAPGVEMRNKVVQVSLDGMNTSLSGASHGEIRAQLLSLYKKLTGV